MSNKRTSYRPQITREQLEGMIERSEEVRHSDRVHPKFEHLHQRLKKLAGELDERDRGQESEKSAPQIDVTHLFYNSESDRGR